MEQMREIVTMEQANHLFVLLAIALPIAGILIGAAVGARDGRTAGDARTGFFIGLLGPLNLLLWTIYNAITNRIGLDRVSNLLVNLALFISLGVVAGLIFGWRARVRLANTNPSDRT